MKPRDFLQTFGDLSPQEKIQAMVRVLTGPEGCPWDQKQTAHSIIDFVIDEAHELKSALDKDDPQEITSELGDLMFTSQFLYHTLESRATPEQASQTLVEKMIRRHPHVFSDRQFATEGELKNNWEAEKRKENRERKRFDQDIPPSLPPLQKATKVLSRAANSGFRYDREADAWDKICEEFYELESALQGDSSEFEEELGDLMLALLTLSKMKNCRPEGALNSAVTKLCDRLEKAEKVAGRPLNEIPRQELKSYYNQGKEADTSTNSVYLNYCGVSPWPREVRNQVRQACHRIGTQGLPAALELLEKRETLKEKIRKFCGASTGTQVVLVPNVSTAALGVAYAQPWKRGDKLLLGRREFPANTVPWRQAAETFGLEIVWIDEDRFRTDPASAFAQLEQLLEAEKPKIMALSAVSFWSGFRYPVEQIAGLCRSFQTRLYIDAIQALGNCPFGWTEELDYLAGGSHKAMLSPEGAGFLLVHSQAAADWEPRLASWLSVPEPINFLMSGEWQSVPSRAAPRTSDPSTLQGASLNSIGYAGLEAAVDFLQAQGVEAIFRKVQALHDPLEKAMEALGWKSLRAEKSQERSAILSFKPPSSVDLTKVQAWLAENNISAGIPNGALRFGFHGFNEAPEVERVIQMMKAMPAEVGSPAR